MTTQVPTIEQEKLNITEMQMELQNAGSIDKNDTLYIGEILAQETAKNTKGNPYKKFQIQILGDQGRTYWNQFNGLEKASVSGLLVRNVKVGDLIVWAGIIKPNPQDSSKFFNNINQLITKVIPEPDDLFGEEEGNEEPSGAPSQDIDPLDDTTEHRLEVEGQELIKDIDSREARPVVEWPKEQDRYIKANNINSISIERQVAVKAGTEITLKRADLVQAVIANFPLAGMESIPELENVLDALWSWVCLDQNHHDTGVVERAKAISMWLEFNK